MSDEKIITNVRITAFQRAVFQRMGGVKWLRRTLDRASGAPATVPDKAKKLRLENKALSKQLGIARRAIRSAKTALYREAKKLAADDKTD